MVVCLPPGPDAMPDPTFVVIRDEPNFHPTLRNASRMGSNPFQSTLTRSENTFTF